MMHTTVTAKGAKVMLTASFAAVIMIFAAACQEPAPTPLTQGESGAVTDNMGDAGSPGISEDRILFGQSAAFSGPAQELGRGMRLGIEAAFHEQNQAGGVHGRMLELTTRDDQYEPHLAYGNTLNLINRDRVFALIGEIGTPTSRSASPLANSQGVPFIAPFTGAGFLRRPSWRT